MADSTNLLNQIVVGQAQPAVPANQLFASTSPAATFSRNESASSLLTWAYYGGYYNGIAVANGTLSLTASQANIYIVALKATGVVSFSAAITNYNNTTDYDRLYRVTTSATAATVWEDKRQIIGSSGVFIGGTLSGALNEAPAVTLASAATVNIGAAAANTINVTGTTTITAFDSIAASAIRRVIFGGILTLTHNATSLILPTAASITTAADDVAEFVSLGSGNWRCTGYERASGAALSAAGTFTGGTLTSALNEAPIVTLASAGTVNIGAAAANTTSISGTTTITAFDTIASGAIRRLVFEGILTLTHNATSLILPTGASIATAAGDVAEFVSLGAGNWRCTGYERASGQALVGASGFQPLDSDLTTIAGLTATTDSFMQAKSSAWASRTVAQVSTDLQGTGLLTDAVGFRTVPQNSKSAAYTTVAADSGNHILHPSADTTARTFTIDSNANVAYPVGTAITIVNQNAGGVITIAITTDTMRLAGAGTTGSRTLAANGIATALKITTTEWIVSGTGLT